MREEYVYVAVDETGNLGMSLKGERYYTVVACVVNDRKRFEDATRRLGFSEEVKFNTHEYLREKVLEYAAPAVSDVYYVRYHKKKTTLNGYEQRDLHLNMMQSLADTIVLSYGMLNNIVAEVDEKDGIPEWKVRTTFENNEYRRNMIICEVLESCDSYGLQTNDFFVGAVGRMLNHADTRYIKHFVDHPREAYLRSKNKKSQGKPASTTWNTGHTDSHNDSSPGIAVQLHTDRVRYPTVRLSETTVSDYINNSEKRGFFKRWRR